MILSIAGLAFAQWHVPATADPGRRVGLWLQDVSRDYSEQGWAQKSKRYPQGYMRPADDKGWQTRMLALRAVVIEGKLSIPSLLEAMESSDISQRVFAAQALGYLGADLPSGPLLHAAREDKLTAVRLYAVDALGMRGNAANAIDWMSLRKQEPNGDVRKHIGYAVERKNAGIHQEVVQTLKNWNPQSMN
ncbi:MAG: HEAT repeat domain-containing protein, partial [Planctomycetaceae bacterium]|nr:HEAT repeat domain-containing protein [Planctomycetaceae bacterium]